MVYWSMSTLKLWKHVPRNQNKTSFLTTWKLPATVSQETENIPTSQADALQYSHCSRHDMAKWLSGHDMSWNLNLQFFFYIFSFELRLSETLWDSRTAMGLQWKNRWTKFCWQHANKFFPWSRHRHFSYLRPLRCIDVLWFDFLILLTWIEPSYNSMVYNIQYTVYNVL